MRNERKVPASIAIAVFLLAGGFCGAVRAEDGDLWTRKTLVGDRTELEKHGVKIDATVTQIEQGVVNGGKDSGWEYGGRGNLTTNLDSQKLGLWPGGFLTFELEGNWSDSVSGKTGGLMPANTNQLFPLPLDDNVAIPNLTLAQFVSHYLGVVVGKMDTSVGDANEFADGKGDTQFMNVAFNINPLLLAVPYSTLGAGLIVLPTQDPEQALLTFLVLSAQGKASTTGFGDLRSDSLVFTGEGRVRTEFLGLTGHQVLGGFYSNRDYLSLDQRLQVGLGGLKLSKQEGTWAAYYNFDQFIYETDKAAGKGLGIFGRVGVAEGEPNPGEVFLSFGFGGKGLVPGRGHDRFGIGAYYLDVNSLEVQGPLGRQKSLLTDELGFEAYYNIALTPWLLLTPDFQFIAPTQKYRVNQNRPSGRERIDYASVLGFRLQVVF